MFTNTERFSSGRLFGLWKTAYSRSMQSMGMMYPYWENAARVVEDRCARLLLAAVLALLIPAVTAAVFLIRILLRGKEALEEEWLPRARDGVEEALRRQQRRRWESRHGAHEK